MSDAVSVVLGPVGSVESAARELRAVDGVAEVITPDFAAVGAALAHAPVLVTWRWSDEWLESDLEWIQSYSAGVEQFPVERLRDAGIVLTSAVGIHDVQVSEHAFGLVLGLTRGIAESARQQTSRTWRWPHVFDLADRTLGILGLGVIGEAIAVKAKAFGMHVIATKRDPVNHAGTADEVFGANATVEVCQRSDVVVAVLPDTPDTRSIVDAPALAALEGGIFINVGRGAAVDEAALIAALNDGTLAGAGLDVFATEPLPQDSPLWAMPNVLVTPHVAGSSPRYGERLAALFARNLAAYRTGDGWVNRVG